MKRIGIAATLQLFLVMLCGCVSFLPNQKEDIYKNLTNVGEQLAKIQTTIAVDAPAKTEYAKVEPFYIAALASASLAGKAATSRADYYNGRIPEVPAANSVKAIEFCRDAIEADRKEVKVNGFAANAADNLNILANTCSIATTIEKLFVK